MANSPAAQSIKVVTALFAALVGIGLTQLLDDDKSNLHKEADWWPFTVALLLSLRLMTGSANHLWHDHVNKTPQPAGGKIEVNKAKLMFDLGLLSAFGCVIAVMCYAQGSGSFFVLGAGLMFGAAIWDAIDWWLLKNSDWWFWLPLDILHCAVFLLVLMSHQPWWSWGVVLLASLILLVIDFWCQLVVVSGEKVVRSGVDMKPVASFLARATLTVMILGSALLVGLLFGGALSQLFQERVVRMGWNAYYLWWIPVRLVLLSASIFLVLSVGRFLPLLKEAWDSVSTPGEWSPPMRGWARMLTGGIAFLAFVTGLLFAPAPQKSDTASAQTPHCEPGALLPPQATTVIPVLFELAGAGLTKGTTLTDHHQRELRTLLTGLKECVSPPNIASVELTVKGFADDNEFRNLKKDQQPSVNLRVANSRGNSVSDFVEKHTKSETNAASTDSQKLKVIKWRPWDTLQEMQAARPYRLRPIAESQKAEDYFNRRADVVIKMTGECKSLEKAR